MLDSMPEHTPSAAVCISGKCDVLSASAKACGVCSTSNVLHNLDDALEKLRYVLVIRLSLSSVQYAGCGEHDRTRTGTHRHRRTRIATFQVGGYGWNMMACGDEIRDLVRPGSVDSHGGSVLQHRAEIATATSSDGFRASVLLHLPCDQYKAVRPHRKGSETNGNDGQAHRSRRR